MRLIGVRASRGVDPFSLSQSLDRLVQHGEITTADSLFVKVGEDVAPVVQAWGDMAGLRIVPVTAEHELTDFINSLVDVIASGEGSLPRLPGVPTIELACQCSPSDGAE